MLLAETWLRSTTPNRLLVIPGYTLCRVDRPDGSGYGGVAIITKAKITSTALKIPGSGSSASSLESLYGTHGCTAGRAEQAFEYLSSSGDGLSKAADYRYYGGDWESCRSHTGVAHISDWRFTSRASEPELEYVVATVGPTAARIDADHTAFQLYAGGVLHVNHCSTDRPTLAVEVVGFGSEDYFGQLVTYWLIKNSWGPGWGEYGYLKLHKDANNMCGIATDASYPLVG
ncbi:cathepsin L-like, partial [Amphibalanus amphitrite]|uniref:cathepsin L-like n=1 Tax=Amphibalanus amphitrite TaxID=1232801 RepID=UPI001C929482